MRQWATTASCPLQCARTVAVQHRRERVLCTPHRRCEDITCSGCAGRSWSGVPVSEGAGTVAGMSHLFVGVDCETSGRVFSNGARLIQAGFSVRDAAGTLQVFSELVRPRRPYLWEEEAFQVHHINRWDVESADDADTVDAHARSWLHHQFPDTELVAVGLNIGSFDFPFLHDSLPSTMTLFTHRSVDLNSVFYTLDGQTGLDGNRWTWLAWKRAAAQFAQQQLADQPGQAHDAGWDAASAIIMHEWLISHIRTT